MRKIKVFIVEDSILMQRVIMDILSEAPNIEVVGTAKFGKEALERIPQVSPDVVTLDINLPDIDGLAVLRELMNKSPTRVITLSAFTRKGADTTLKALELGALDFIPKPSGEISLDLYNFKEEIISKIEIVAGVDLEKYFISRGIAFSKKDLEVEKLVVIGASTGGPKAILEIMNRIPSRLEASFLIVQHMPAGFTKSFAERIAWYSDIKAKEAEEGDRLLRRVAYVAPGGFHLLIDKINQPDNSYCLRLDDTESVNYVKPAVDVTMESAAQVFEGRIVGVILTGMGRDGLAGARRIKEKGGRIIVQDERSCVVYGMPSVVVNEGLADEVLPPEAIAEKIVEYLDNGEKR